MSARFKAIRRITTSGRTKTWLVVDERREFPNWVFAKYAREWENRDDAVFAAELLNTSYHRAESVVAGLLSETPV